MVATTAYRLDDRVDSHSFDALTRSLAAPRTRRGLLGTIAAFGAGLLGAKSADAQVSQAQCGNVTCRTNPARCNAGCVCCDYGNGNSRCRPPGTCSPGVVLCPPGQVLGPSGVCAAPTTTTTAAPCPPFTSPCGDACCTDITGVSCDENGCCQTRLRDRRFPAQGSCTAEVPCCSGRLCQSGRCCEPLDSACTDPQGNECCDGLVCLGGRCVAAA